MDDHDKLRATFGWRWCRRSPRAPQPGSVDQVARWSETPVAFARWYLCGIETAIAFAGEKWAFLLLFLGAEVSSVSAAPCWECAVVLLVSRSPCFCVLCAIFFALLGRVWVRARKSSPRKPKMGEKRCFQARWASFFAEELRNGARWASFFAELLLNALMVRVWCLRSTCGRGGVWVFRTVCCERVVVSSPFSKRAPEQIAGPARRVGRKGRGASGVLPNAPRPRRETLATQRRSTPASQAARMGFASATS